MNYPTRSRPWARSVVWVSIAVLGAVLFGGLVIVTEGILFPMIITAVTVGAIGLVHYFFWGREFLKDVAPARAAAATLARTERDSVQPAPPVILELTERHRVELIRVLEEWLATTGTAARSAPQSRDTNEAVREALDKLRSFGA